jgi:hypothetical protein
MKGDKSDASVSPSPSPPHPNRTAEYVKVVHTIGLKVSFAAHSSLTYVVVSSIFQWLMLLLAWEEPLLVLRIDPNI